MESQYTSRVDPGQIQAISRLLPSYTQHTSGMIHATFRPKLRRRKGLHLPDVRRPTIPFCIFFVFLRFLKSLVLCDISCFAGAVLPPSQMVLFASNLFCLFLHKFNREYLLAHSIYIFYPMPNLQMYQHFLFEQVIKIYKKITNTSKLTWIGTCFKCVRVVYANHKD